MLGGPVSLDPRDGEAIRACRVRHAVVDVRSANGTLVQLVATADARAWLGTRFLDGEAPGGLDEQGRPVADLRAVAGAVHLTPCGSGLEADLRWLDAWRSHRPGEEVPGTPRLIYVTVGAEQGVERLVPIDLMRERPAGRAVGPFAILAAAKRYGSLGVTLLGFSDHPSLLEVGSPEREAYRAGLAEWLGWRGMHLEARLTELHQAMRTAAGDQEFERAAELKSRIDMIEAFGVEERAAIAAPEAFRWLVLAPGLEKRTVRPLVITPAGWRAMPDREADAVDVRTVFEADGVAGDLMSCDANPNSDTTLMATAAARLLRPVKPVSWFRLGETVDENVLLEAARRAAGLKSTEPEPAKDASS